MRSNNLIHILFLFLLIFFQAHLPLTRAANLESTWRDREISIDGKQEEWQGQLVFPSELLFGVGLMNDENFLYICFASTDRSILRRAMGFGLTVWLEPEGSKKKFGIRFPVGRPLGAMPFKPNGTPPDSQASAEVMLESVNQVEIIGPEKKDTLRAQNFEDQGIIVKIGQSSERFVYELKVPLGKTGEQPLALAVKEGKPLKIRFETGKMNMDEIKKRMRGPEPGRMGDPGTGRMGGPPGRGGKGIRNMMEPFEWSAKIYLATKEPQKKAE